MSQYVNIYLKTKKEEWIALDSFSRNTSVYRYVEDYIPYDQGALLDDDTFRRVTADIKEDLTKYDKYNREAEQQKILIASMNNSVEDKLQAIREIEGSVEDYNELKDDLTSALGVFMTLWGISDYNEIYAGIEWNPNYNEDE